MLGFCEKCRDMVKYIVRNEEKTKNIKGKIIEYIAKEAYCSECGSELFVADIRDYNLSTINKAFRELENLITVAEIKKILEIYDIGKRPLSLLLGWGEGTVTRYLNGDIPTKQYSDTLKKILDDLDYMEEILDRNKGNITDLAFRRCKEAIFKNKIEPFRNEIEGKIDNVVRYLLLDSSDITPLSLQKLLYYAQGFYKVFTGEYLFNDDCEAWVHGPVYRNIYYKYKDHGYNPIEEDISEYADVQLMEIEKEILDSVLSNLGCYSGKILERMTHAELPWRSARKDLREDEGSNRFIDKELIDKYFSEIKCKYNMINISDIKDYSMDLFRKLYH